MLETQLAAVRKGKQKKLELITEKGSLSADYLLVQHGHQRDATFLDQLSFKMKRKDDFYLDCEEPTKTSISGCFAAGDIQYSKGKVYLLAGAFQEAVHSINQIKQFLNPDSMAFGQVSSHNHKFDTLNQTLLK